MNSGQAVRVIHGIISDLPLEEQARVAQCMTRLLAIEREYGATYKVALGLLAAEMAADARRLREAEEAQL